MTGEVAKYGENFRLEHVPPSPDMANRLYVLKRDDDWWIRSDKSSKIWMIFHNGVFMTERSSLGKAMSAVFRGIELGFYSIKGEK